MRALSSSSSRALWVQFVTWSTSSLRRDLRAERLLRCTRRKARGGTCREDDGRARAYNIPPDTLLKLVIINCFTFGVF